MPRHNLHAAAAALIAFAFTGIATADATAQMFAGVGAGAGVAMPDASRAAPVEPAPPAQVLRHLPSTLDGLQLIGESGDLQWPIYLSRAQAAGGLRVRVGYVSAVSILPDASKMTIRLNGHEIGADVIDAPRGLRTVEFAVPMGVATEGYNALAVSVRQRHRVDCSVPATYELWTKIDPIETGIVVRSEARGMIETSELAALLPRADGTLPIHILLPGKTTPPHLNRLIAATSAVALAAHAVQPAVDFDGTTSDVYGIDLVVETRTVLAKGSRFASALGTAGPSVRVMAPTSFGRPTLVITGADDADLDAAIATVASSVSDKGSVEGLLAAKAYPGLRMDGEEGLALRELGIRSEEFSGRFLRKSVNLALPADFLASDYGRGTFDLAGAYAAGLTHGAQVRVDVNGKSSGTIKLPYANGDVFRHNQLFLPLSLMRPGLNRIDIFAETPRAEDASCEASDDKRFLFSDSSKIVLPTLARVQRLPDLALATSGGLPFAKGDAHLVVPKPDRGTMGSALSLTARASVAAGHVIPFAFSTAMPTGASGSLLVVSPARALDPEVMTGIGLDPAEVEAAWRDAAAKPLTSTQTQGRWWLANNDGPAACRLPSAARSAAAPSAASPSVPVTPVTPTASSRSDTEDLLENWSEERHPRRDWLGGLWRLVDRVQAFADSVPRMIRSRIGSGPRSDGITPEASLILAQGMRRDSSNAVTTIVTAPSSQMLQASLPCLFDPQVWSQVHGRLAALDASRGVVTATDATKYHYAFGSRLSLANARLVVAGWFSLDPIAFVAVAMLMALSLSGSTLWFVRGIGRRSE